MPSLSRLKKELGLMSTVSLIAGTIIGSGIFLTPNDLVLRVGSYGMALVIWLVAGIVVLLASLCYAELGVVLPESGGEYTYFRHAFGGLPAFVYAWMSAIAIWPMSLGITLLTFARYLSVPFYGTDCEPPDYTVKTIAVAALVFMTVVGCVSSQWSAHLTSMALVIKLLAVALLVVLGIVSLSQGNVGNLQHAFQNTTVKAGSLAFAFYDSFWAYAGWNNANFVVGELKDPKILPVAIIIAVPLVVVCYILVNMAYMSILSRAVFIKSQAIALDAAQHIIGNAGLVIMPLLVASSCFGSANGASFAGARVSAESARRGDVPRVFGLIHDVYCTPVTALIMQAVFTAIYIVAVDINSLLLLFSFQAWFFYGASFLVLILLRYREPSTPRAIKVPLPIPIALIGVSAFLVIAPFYQYPVKSSIALGIMLFSSLLYFIFVTRSWLPRLGPHLDKASAWSVRAIQCFIDAT